MKKILLPALLIALLALAVPGLAKADSRNHKARQDRSFNQSQRIYKNQGPGQRVEKRRHVSDNRKFKRNQGPDRRMDRRASHGDQRKFKHNQGPRPDRGIDRRNRHRGDDRHSMRRPPHRRPPHRRPPLPPRERVVHHRQVEREIVYLPQEPVYYEQEQGCGSAPTVPNVNFGFTDNGGNEVSIGFGGGGFGFGINVNNLGF
ncbi:MAG: hypothetical protein LBF58_02625 [Deltaproteobacteria bacterium]|nr:hypothetical protein [Deltaproteobacteria bacterium]